MDSVPVPSALCSTLLWKWVPDIMCWEKPFPKTNKKIERHTGFAVVSDGKNKMCAIMFQQYKILSETREDEQKHFQKKHT